MSVTHAFTVDVEDWFQVANLMHLIDRSDWDKMERRVAANTDRLLALLADRGVRGTFFTLGWVAEKEPALVRRIVDAGHEIASHGWEHGLVGDLGPDGFRSDVAHTKAVLEDTAGVEVQGFRASTWTITSDTLWALDVLLEEGYRYDSSIFPVRHPDYGIPGAPRLPHRRTTPGGAEIAEFPPLTMRVLGRTVGAGGGGYLRLLPMAINRAAFRAREREGAPGCLYVHPWEVDPEQPLPAAFRGLGRFRHTVRLERTESRLAALLDEFEFGPMGEVLEQWEGRGLG